MFSLLPASSAIILYDVYYLLSGVICRSWTWAYHCCWLAGLSQSLWMKLSLSVRFAFFLFQCLLFCKALNLHEELHQSCFSERFEYTLGRCLESLKFEQQVLSVDEWRLAEGIIAVGCQHFDANEGIDLKLLVVTWKNTLKAAGSFIECILNAIICYDWERWFPIHHELSEQLKTIAHPLCEYDSERVKEWLSFVNNAPSGLIVWLQFEWEATVYLLGDMHQIHLRFGRWEPMRTYDCLVDEIDCWYFSEVPSNALLAHLFIHKIIAITLLTNSRPCFECSRFSGRWIPACKFDIVLSYFHGTCQPYSVRAHQEIGGAGPAQLNS